MSLWRRIVDKQKVSRASAPGDSVCTVAKSKSALLGLETPVKTRVSPAEHLVKESLLQPSADSTTGETTFLFFLITLHDQGGVKKTYIERHAL